ncbi:unnamed protein product [Cylindrotheca closterium]|uniref:Uncharacterized protein n=1 Tax=Cylindrotheca closterium TaxID=2856 RepID=A0AAD2JPD9_9STRA|nr:unnamed protein product [Cylindrotheca closterium]
MYKSNSLVAFLKDEMNFSWEDDIFESDEEETVVMGKRCVRFSDNIEIQEIPCISDMETSEIADVWYTRLDHTVMRAEYKQLAKSVMSGRIEVSAEDICLRGLEEKFYRSQKKVKRSEAIGAVLDEQDAQFGYGEQNAEMIARVYNAFTAYCIDESVEMALRDETAAFKIHGISSIR